jgi:hypothetical protein
MIGLLADRLPSERELTDQIGRIVVRFGRPSTAEPIPAQDIARNHRQQKCEYKSCTATFEGMKHCFLLGRHDSLERGAISLLKQRQ